MPEFICHTSFCLMLQMDAPQTSLWGPPLWHILHSAAERIGTKALKRIPQEESRIWMGILRALQFTLPCPQCKRHYTAYLVAHPVLSFTKEYLREWLYQLHTAVNQQTQKPNTMTIVQVEEHYGQPFHFSKHLSAVSHQMSTAVRLGWSSYEDTKRVLRFFEEMKRFYDFF